LGKLIGWLTQNHGICLTNDSPIAMSAGRLGVTVITANGRDFAKLAEFRPFQWRVEKPEAD
jgi:predicted nucleic acid-binding protein